jgi:hypothetical protein
VSTSGRWPIPQSSRGLTPRTIVIQGLVATEDLGDIITPAGLEHTRALGSPIVSPQLRPASLEHTRALGSPLVTNAIIPASLERTRALGSPQGNPTIILTGLVRTRELGTPTFAGFQPAAASHTHSINPHQHRDGDTA